MFSIAICDNDTEELDKISSAVDLYFARHQSINGHKMLFSNPESLLQTMEVSNFNTYILDIIMPEINGIELGAAIRDKWNNVPVIYVTSSKDYAYNAFGIRALDYLDKPIDNNRLANALDRAYSVYVHSLENVVSIPTRDGRVSVDINEIMYVENVSRAAEYTLWNGQKIKSICNRTAFEKSITPISSNRNFIQPHKSFFVNMQNIKVLKTTNLIIDDGTQIPVSHDRAAATKKAYLQFLTFNGGME